MKRAYLSIRLAIEALIGIVMLFECAKVTVAWPARITSIAVIVGILIGIGLVYDAFRVRRMLNNLDSVNDPTPD